MADISTESLIKSIKVILKGADLSKLSAKKVRKSLETEHGTDLTARKEEIDKLVMELITQGETDEEPEEPEEKKTEQKKTAKSEETEVIQKVANGSKPSPKRAVSPAKKDKGKPQAPEDKHLSNDELSDDDNKDDMADDAVDTDSSDMGEIEDYVPVKKAKTQPSSKKAKSSKKLDDEELAKQLQEVEGQRPRRSCKAVPVVRKPRKPRKESQKGTSVYSRPCALSSPLSEVMGTDLMPRPMIVKRLWQIVRERDLLDPSNKQFMLCDSEMLGLFGKKRVRMFGVMKYLSPYIKNLPKE